MSTISKKNLKKCMRVTNQNKTDAIKPTCSLKQNKGYKIKDKHKNEIE
jgi:hypothetical protein